MHDAQGEQLLHIGVDVGGTFTDLVAWNGSDLRIVKLPSTPPQFYQAVIDAVARVQSVRARPSVVHGSTVATNALLQRAFGPIAFVTTEGFRDMLLIGRQNRPELYALRVRRGQPVTGPDNWFTVRERIDARGGIVQLLSEEEIDRLVEQISSRGLQHAAVCLLFSYVNPVHEQQIARKLQAAGIAVSLSSQLMPEFREYERASTTAINAALHPVVETYLASLQRGLPGDGLRIMHSGGGTLPADDAARHAVRLVLSGPAGGVIGAAFVAKQAAFEQVISYDMGGTSTDVATIVGGQPQWSTSTTIDGLHIGLPMFQIETVGAGGGSIAYVDTGGALRVGPQSAGAVPGPACYGRGGHEPTVTDANVVLGRIVPRNFLGGEMKLDPDAAHRAIERLAERVRKTPLQTALGIVRVVEANMAHAVRAVTSRKGLDPRQFVLVSFGGAGGLHACGVADALDIARVLVPPYCGVLSALGMIVAPPVVDVSQTILGRDLDDSQLAGILASLSARSASDLPDDQTAAVEYHADVRFAGQSHELTIPLRSPTLAQIDASFRQAYVRAYGQIPSGRAIEVVSLRVRRRGHAVNLTLPRFSLSAPAAGDEIQLVDEDGRSAPGHAVQRAQLLSGAPVSGPLLIVDPESTTYLPRHWNAGARAEGSILLTRRSRANSSAGSN